MNYIRTAFTILRNSRGFGGVSFCFSSKKPVLFRTGFFGKLGFQLEGFAVGAVLHGGVHLMCPNGDAVQRAVILPAAVMGALLYGTFDTCVFVAVTIHKIVPPFLDYKPSFAWLDRFYT